MAGRLGRGRWLVRVEREGLCLMQEGTLHATVTYRQVHLVQSNWDFDVAVAGKSTAGPQADK